MITLRPYQSDIIEAARDRLKTARTVLIQAPTGSGKTALATHMIGTAARRGKTAWFICHRDFLLHQTATAFEAVGVPHGFIAARREFNPYRSVQIAGIDTLRHRLAKLEPPDLIVWDEAHHIAASSWGTVYAWARRSRHIGLSATPARLDGRGLDAYFDDLVTGPSVAWLIEAGYLSRYRAFAPTSPDVSRVHSRAGDYARGELASVMDTDTIAGDIVGHYRRIANGKRAIYFAVSVEHSQHMAASFNAAGVAARHLDAGASTVERMDAAARLGSGALSVITNVDLCGEGYDLSAQAGFDVPIEAVGLCRPTQSLALHLQQVGRALRPKTEPAIILDHAGNIMRHGLPDDDREWSLAGIDKKARGKDYVPPVRLCGHCFACYSAAIRICPQCGTIAEVDARIVDEVAIDLEEVDAERLRRTRKMEQARAGSFPALVELGRERGYRNPVGWARHVLDARGSGHRQKA